MRLEMLSYAIHAGSLACPSTGNQGTKVISLDQIRAGSNAYE